MGEKVNIMGKDLRHDCAGPLKNQRGSAAIDYAMILVFVVLAVVAIIVTLKAQSEEIFEATGTVIGDFSSIPKE